MRCLCASLANGEVNIGVEDDEECHLVDYWINVYLTNDKSIFYGYSTQSFGVH